MEPHQIANPDNDQRIHIKVDGPSIADTHVKLSGGQTLGLIQAIQIDLRVGHVPRVVLESILEKAEIEVLQSQTEVKVILPEGAAK